MRFGRLLLSRPKLKPSDRDQRQTITFTALQDAIKHCRSKFEGCDRRNELADATEWLQALQHLEARVTELEANAKREAQEEKDKAQAARTKDAAAKKSTPAPAFV